MNDILAVRGLTKNYIKGRNVINAVTDVNINVKPGSHVLIVGPSGAGKSTLLHMLGGLDKPTRGKILLSGYDMYSLSDSKRAYLRNRRIGFVFQFYNLLSEFTVLENVILPAIMNKKRRKTKKNIYSDARSLIDRVGLSKRFTHKPSELSGGEAQRVAVARALINEPELLLCDEPTGNLDSTMSELIYGIIGELSREKKMTVIIITHHNYKYYKFDNEYIMIDGKIRISQKKI